MAKQELGLEAEAKGLRIIKLVGLLLDTSPCKNSERE